MAKIVATASTRQLQRKIGRLVKAGVVSATELVNSAAGFYVQSATKAMPPSKKSLKRKIYTFTQRGRNRVKYGFFNRTTGQPITFHSRAKASRESVMKYRFVAKWAFYLAGRALGLANGNAPHRSEKGPEAAAQLFTAKRSREPSVTFTWSAAGIKSPPGARARGVAAKKTIRRLVGWHNRLRRQIAAAGK